MFRISAKEMTAIRKHAATLVDDIDLSADGEYEPEARSRGQLKEHQRAIMRAAKLNSAALEKVKSDDEARSIELAHDALMSLHDAIEDEFDSRASERSGSRQSERRDIPMQRNVSAVAGDSGDEIRSDLPVETFSLRGGETYTDFVMEHRSGRSRQFDSITPGAYLRSIVMGPKDDIERRALSEGTDSAGGYTVPDVLSARLIDRMRAASVVMRAGAQTVPLTSDRNFIAVVASDPLPAWRVENAALTESDPTFGRVEFTARSLGVLVKVSRELLQDSLNIEQALTTTLTEALAGELDRAALLGTGTAPQPRGVANFAGLTTSNDTVGDLGSYAPFIQARTALRTANSDVTAFIMSPRDEGHLAGMVDTTGQPKMMPEALRNVPMLTTTKIPTDLGTGTDESIILGGDWRRLMVGVRSELRIEVLRERFADNMQVAFIAHLRADIAAEHQAAFTKLAGVTIP